MKRWQSWTEEQDDVLREFGSYGAAECARIIDRRFKVRRSTEAVRRHAYRIGASIIQFRICSGCGNKARKFYKDGLCPTCHQKELAERQKRENTVLIKEIKLSESGEEFNRAKREYDKARQQNHRIRERLNSRKE